MIPAQLQTALEDPAVTDICINGPDRIFVDRGAGLMPTPYEPWAECDYRSWVLRLISDAGRSWDAKHPFIDLSMQAGHRLHVVFPPASHEHVLLSIRKLKTSATRSSFWAGDPGFTVIRDAFRAGESILFSGGTGTGKTTLMCEILETSDPRERIVALEDVRELSPHLPHFISLCSREPNSDGFGGITLRQLLRQTLRMRPDRIVLGECRGEEVLELLQALNTGHQGATATIHANRPRDALRRVELLCALATKGTLSSSVIRELIATGLRWVVQLKRTEKGRCIENISRIEGREGDTILLRPVLEREAGKESRAKA